MRQWRKDYQGNMWTKGSRASCCGRFFCCTLMIFLLLLISVVLTIALVSVSCKCHVSRGSQAAPSQYLRPPNVIVGKPTVDVNSFAINSSSISIALPVDIRYLWSSLYVLALILISWQRQQPKFLYRGAV